MNIAAADRIAKAVLYEGYMLYPYRPSSVKNQQRFNFGVVYPQLFSAVQKGTDPWTMRTECLVQGRNDTRLEVRVRFLQLVERSVEEAVGKPLDDLEISDRYRTVRSLAVDDRTFYSWQEAVECEIDLPIATMETLARQGARRSFQMPASVTEESLRDSRGISRGRVVRSQHPIDGSISLRAEAIAPDVFKIVLQVENVTPIDDPALVNRDYILLRSLVSTHAVLGAEDGRFVSLLDPPENLQVAASGCRNQGAYPVLVGDDGERDTMLASPIILYDYPEIAPESAGDLFDGTEIDEILSLRIMTMTDDEKREMCESDDRARQMLERTESMPQEQFAKLHGALRGLRPVKEQEAS